MDISAAKFVDPGILMVEGLLLPSERRLVGNEVPFEHPALPGYLVRRADPAEDGRHFSHARIRKADNTLSRPMGRVLNGRWKALVQYTGRDSQGRLVAALPESMILARFRAAIEGGIYGRGRARRAAGA